MSPYIWIPGVNLNINALRASTSTNIPWWDIASRLFTNAIGVMGRAEAWKGRWGLYFDGYYTYLGGSGSQVGATRTQSLGPVNFAIDRPVTVDGATFRLNIPGQASGSISLTPSGSASYISRVVSLDMGGRYLVGTRSWQPDREFPVLSLEILGGVRFNSFNQFLKINYSAVRVGQVNVDFRRFSLSAEHQSIINGSYTLDATLQVVEPFIGPRIYIWFNPKASPQPQSHRGRLRLWWLTTISPAIWRPCWGIGSPKPFMPMAATGPGASGLMSAGARPRFRWPAGLMAPSWELPINFRWWEKIFAWGDRAGPGNIIPSQAKNAS